MTTPVSELERLFAPQFDLVEISGGELSYVFSQVPEQPELRHVRREDLPTLAEAVRILQPAYRVNSILPNLAPSTSTSFEPAQPLFQLPVSE